MYQMAQNRLINTMRGQNIPLVYYVGTGAVNAPTHQQDPFAFKIYSIEAALKLGYTQIFWVDSCVWPVKPIEPIFERLTQLGMFIEDSGHPTGKWVEEKVLSYFGITREVADDIDMISAGFIGLDFEQPISKTFFYLWKEAMQHGMFKGDTIQYRNEQACASIIANKLHIPMSKSNEYFAYVGEPYGTPPDTAIFHLQGM
jgi:hypothetical protein